MSETERDNLPNDICSIENSKQAKQKNGLPHPLIGFCKIYHASSKSDASNMLQTKDTACQRFCASCSQITATEVTRRRRCSARNSIQRLYMYSPRPQSLSCSATLRTNFKLVAPLLVTRSMKIDHYIKFDFIHVQRQIPV